MSEAELRIRPTLVGDFRSELRNASREARRLERSHMAATNRGMRDAQKLERAWDGVGRSIRTTGSGLGGITRGLTSIQGIAMGIAGGMAGRTVFDLMIGSNAELETAKITFNAMIGDAGKAQRLISDLREQARTTPFRQSDLIEGSRRLLRLTGTNIERNKELLNVALNMSSLNPTKSVTDAAEALLDAEMGEFERLKEFGIKLKKESVKKGKKAGEDFGEAAMRGVAEALNAQTGGADLVGGQSNSFTGRLSTLQDMIKNTFQETGKRSFKVFSEALGDVQGDLDKVLQSDEFQGMMEDVSLHAESFAKWISEGVRRIPSLISQSRQFFADAKEFWDDNKTLIMMLGGGLALNKMTDGGLGRGLDSAGQRLLFGRGSGGAGGAAGAFAGMVGPSGAVPVYIVGGAGTGGGVGDVMARARGGRGMAPLTTAGLFSQGGLTGASASVGAGGAFGLAAIPGSFILAAKTFYDVVNDTSEIVARFDARARTTANAPLTDSQIERDKRDLESTRLQSRTQLLTQMLGMGNVKGAKSEVIRMLGGSRDRFEGHAVDQQTLEDINAALGPYGLKASIGKGRRNSAVKFKGGAAARTDEEKARYKELIALRNNEKISDAVLRASKGDSGPLKELGLSPDDVNRMGGDLLDLEATAEKGKGLSRALNRTNVGKVEVNNYFSGPLTDSGFEAARKQSMTDARRLLEDALNRDATEAQD